MTLHSPKTILLMRHAKSFWGVPALSDYERPLDAQGKEDAFRMAKFLAKQNLIPEQIFSSPAVRAKATTEIMIKKLGLSSDKLIWNDKLYFTGAQSYLNTIRNANESIATILIVGHNPMIEEVLNILSKSIQFNPVGTATIICLKTASLTWKNIQPRQCNVQWIKSPADINQKCSQKV